MRNDIFHKEQLSSNIYVKRSQLIKRIATLRDIFQSQKFTNKIRYSFQDLRENIKHYKGHLQVVENQIALLELNVFVFGS